MKNVLVEVKLESTESFDLAELQTKTYVYTHSKEEKTEEFYGNYKATFKQLTFNKYKFCLDNKLTKQEKKLKKVIARNDHHYLFVRLTNKTVYLSLMVEKI